MTPAQDAAPAYTLVYQDDALLVLDKPSGMLSVPGKGPDKTDCLSARVQACFPDARVVHRLDMDTSGLIVMARNAAVQRSLCNAFALRMVTKRYQAVVDGLVAHSAQQWCTIDLPIAVDWPNRPRRVIASAGGQPSISRLRVVRSLPAQQCTHLELVAETGRTHQLRVHLQAIGHPILGDRLYASAMVLSRAPRLMLHAHYLAFTHPTTSEPLCFSSAAPCAWRAFGAAA